MIDHLMWAAPELQAGCQEMEARLGVSTQVGGRHTGVGTHNALLGLGPGRYMEVIAPDPTQDHSSGFGDWVGSVTSPSLLTWCARSDDLEGLGKRAQSRGLEPSPIAAMQRQRPDGSLLRWRLLFVGGHPFGFCLPFFIDWQDSPHPGQSLPRELTLRRLGIEHPDGPALRDVLTYLLQGFPTDLEIHTSPRERLWAELDTPRGPVTL